MEAISAEGTVLEGISLEELVRNVRNNNLWENEEWVRKEQDLVGRVYQAYLVAIKTDIPTIEISKRYRLDSGTPKNWREKKFPKQLRSYRRSFLPENQKEREYFATLLGIIARVRVHSQLPKKTITKKIPNNQSLQEIKLMFGILSGEETRVKREVISVSNVKFLRTLDYTLENNFERYVNDDKERLAFLRGVFSTTRLLGSGSSRVWELLCGNLEITKKLLNSFLELDIFPKIYDHGNRIAIMSGVCLEKLCKLKIIDNPRIRRMITPPGYAPAKEISPQVYYEIRKKSKRRLDQNEKICPASITNEVCKMSVYNKIDDDENQETSRAVKRYKEVIKFLGLPNVYAADEPVQRNEKWFVPVNDEMFVVPPKIQERYAQFIGIEHFDYAAAVDIGIDLEDFLTNGKKGEFVFSLKKRLIVDVK